MFVPYEKSSWGPTYSHISHVLRGDILRSDILHKFGHGSHVCRASSSLLLPPSQL